MSAHLVACLALGDGHVRHQVAVVGVPQRRRPAADHHLARAEGLQHGPAGHHRGEGAAVLLEGEQPRGEGVLVSAANRLIGEVVQSRRRPLLALSHLRHY